MDNFGKTAVFFRADTAGLRKYGMGGYDRIGVHRVKGVKWSFGTVFLVVSL